MTSRFPGSGTVRWFTALVGLLFVLLMQPVQPHAKNMHGKFGLGYQRTMLGVEGLSFTYWTTPTLAIAFTAGAGWVIDDQDDGPGDQDLSTTTVLGSGAIRYVLLGTKFANLSIGAVVEVGWVSNALMAEKGEVSKLGSETQWGLEIPLHVEFFFSDAFSVNLGTGIVFTSVPNKGSILTPPNPTGLGIVTQEEYMGVGIGVGSLFGMAGFTFYL